MVEKASISPIGRGNRHQVCEIEVGDFEKDHLFMNETDRAASSKFIKYGCFSTDETSIPALIKFVAVMKNATDSLVEFVTSSEFTNNIENVVAALQSSDILRSRTKKG